MNDELKNHGSPPVNSGQPSESEIPMVEKEKYLRLAADFENYRKQQTLAVREFAKFAGLTVISEMLELGDMVDSAVAHAPPEVKSQKAWFAGLEQVKIRFNEDMKKYGVQRIDTAGKTFDPKSMEAVQTVPGGESQSVQSEARPGYTMHERVIRPARVIIYE